MRSAHLKGEYAPKVQHCNTFDLLGTDQMLSRRDQATIELDDGGIDESKLYIQAPEWGMANGCDASTRLSPTAMAGTPSATKLYGNVAEEIFSAFA